MLTTCSCAPCVWFQHNQQPAAGEHLHLDRSPPGEAAWHSCLRSQTLPRGHLAPEGLGSSKSMLHAGADGSPCCPCGDSHGQILGARVCAAHICRGLLARRRWWLKASMPRQPQALRPPCPAVVRCRLEPSHPLCPFLPAPCQQQPAGAWPGRTVRRWGQSQRQGLAAARHLRDKASGGLSCLLPLVPAEEQGARERALLQCSCGG